MISRQRIETKIRQKEQEIHELEQKIREAKSYLQALNDMLKMLPKEGSTHAADALRAGSAMAKARDAIRAAGTPLHVSNILPVIGKEITKKNRVALAGSLAGYARKGVIFTKSAPNTFGLVEQGNSGKIDNLPPDDFGK